MESKEKNSKNSTQTTKNNYESSKKQNGKNVKDKKNGKGAIIGLTIASPLNLRMFIRKIIMNLLIMSTVQILK